MEPTVQGLLIVFFAVLILEALVLASYRLGQTASVFAITFLQLLALSLSHFGGIFGMSLEQRFHFGGIFLTLLPATILTAYILLGIRVARSLITALVAGLAGYTFAWMAGLAAAPLFGSVPLETLPTNAVWLFGALGILAETAGFYAVVPMYSFLGRYLRFPHWARIAATLASVPLANGVIMGAGGALYGADSPLHAMFFTTLAARIVTGILLTPGILIFLRKHLRGSPDAPLSVGPMDALNQLTATRKNLEEAEARYRAMFAAAPDVILRFDRDGTIREINARAEEELGYGPGTLTGLPVWRLWGPTKDTKESERRIRSRLKKIREGEVAEFEGLARRSDGSTLPAAVHLTSVGGPTPGFLAVAHDLSRQKGDRAQLERQVAELNTLAEVAHIASSAQDVASLLKASADRVVEIVGADACYVTLWDERRRRVMFTAASGPDHEQFRALAPASEDEGPSLTGDALAESRPVIVRDFRASPYYRPRLVMGPPMESVVSLPLIGDEQKLGALVVGHLKTHDFTPEEVGTLERAANLIALAMSRMRLLEQTRERQQVSESLRQLGIAFGSTLDYEEILDRILDGLLQVMSCDAANIQLIQNGMARVLRSRGYERFDLRARVEHMTLPLEDTPLLKIIFDTRQPLVVGDVLAEPRWRVPAEWETRPQFWRSWVGAPVIVRGEVIGFINADSAGPGTYTERDAETLALFAAQAAIALENSRLYAEAQEQRIVAETLREAAVVLGSTLDTEAILDQILVLLEKVVPYDAANIQMIREGRVTLSRLRGYERQGPDAERAAREGFFQAQEVPNLRYMMETAKQHFIADTWADPNWIKVPGLEWLRSWAAAPIVVRGRVIGFINVDGTIPNAYSERHASLLAVFAQQAASALENALLYAEAQEQRKMNAQLYEQTRRRVQELTAIYESGRRLQQLYAADALAQEAIDALAEILGYDHGSVMLTNKATGDLVTVALSEPNWDKARLDAERGHIAQFGIRLGVGITGWVAQHGEGLRVGNVRQDPRYLAVREDILSELCVPLRVGDDVIGVLNIEAVEPDAYTEADQRLLETIAAQVALSIQNARLYEQVQRRLQELTAIYQAGQRLQALHPTEELSREVLDILNQLMGYDYGALLLVDKPSGGLFTFAFRQKGQAAETVEGEDARAAGCVSALGKGITGWVAERGESARVGDVSQDSRYLCSRPATRSELCVPLRLGEEVIGVINVESAQPNAYTEADQRLLETVAAQVAIAIQNARLYEDLQKAYEQLKASQDDAMRAERLRALGQMASGIAHDFNNVLTPILGYLELVLENSGLPEGARGDVERARRGALAASGIVARLREFYRPREAAEAFSPVDINRIVSEAVELTRPRWRDIPQEHGVVIDVRLELAQTPRILGDAGALRDLLTNLIINAVDAMPSGGAITIRTSRDGDSVLLTVADTGTGMTEEAKERAFEPFFSTKGAQGTGLGLSICYGIVQRHGGSIDLVSSQNKGTTFVVRLPASVNALPAAPQADLPKLPPLTILLVDDEESVLAVVARMLSRAGHTVIAEAGGQQGIERFDPGKVDVVVTDLGMPQVTGREVARAVKARSPKTPVILLTGWGAKVGKEQGTPKEVDDVLTKPMQFTDLHRSLAKVLGLLDKE